MERIDPFKSATLIENWQTGPVEGSPKSKNLIKEKKEKTFIENQPDDEESPFFSFPLLIALLSSFSILILKKSLKKMYNS